MYLRYLRYETTLINLISTYLMGLYPATRPAFYPLLRISRWADFGLFVFCAAVSVHPGWLTKQVAYQCQIQKAMTPHLGPRRLGQSEGHASAASPLNLSLSSVQ
jgi:hypothetical protein